jgi:hypothetical protein
MEINIFVCVFSLPGTHETVDDNVDRAVEYEGWVGQRRHVVDPPVEKKFTNMVLFSN